MINLWSLPEGDIALAVSDGGSLASGGLDKFAVLWDRVTEVANFV